MILCIDVGNTNVKYAICDRDSFKATFRVATDLKRTSDEYGSQLINIMQVAKIDVSEITGAIISSVVPSLDYTLDKMHPLEITAETQDNNEAVILLNAINGQRFDNVKDNKITDTAAPVLVVNEDISGFQYGTVFSLAYEKVDVLQTSSLWESKKYYQYNPADTAVVYGEKATLTTSTYFMDTVYYVKEEGGVKTYSKTAQEGYTETSVISEEGKEYVSIQITLGDDTFNGTKKDENGNVYNRAVYELAWYANQVEGKKFGETETDYIVIDTNTDGAIYSYISLHETKPENVVDEAKKAEQLEAYQKQTLC